MEKLYLKGELADYLKMLEYERSGYAVLIKEFGSISEEEDLNLDESNFKLLLDRYKEATLKVRLAIEETVGHPVNSFNIDFISGVLEYD